MTMPFPSSVFFSVEISLYSKLKNRINPSLELQKKIFCVDKKLLNKKYHALFQEDQLKLNLIIDLFNLTQKKISRIT